MLLIEIVLSPEMQLAIVEKLIIGVLLLLIGWVVTIRIERSKTKQSLENEINKLRVQNIGKCWKVHSVYRQMLQEFIFNLEKYKKKAMPDEEIIKALEPQIKELEKKKEEVEMTTASHEFWLGEEIYKATLAYNKSFPDFCEVFHDGKFDRCKELKFKMVHEMLDIDDVMGMLTKKIIKRK